MRFCRKSTSTAVLSDSVDDGAAICSRSRASDISEQPRDGLATRRGNYREYLGQDTDHDRRQAGHLKRPRSSSASRPDPANGEAYGRSREAWAGEGSFADAYSGALRGNISKILFGEDRIQQYSRRCGERELQIDHPTEKEMLRVSGSILPLRKVLAYSIPNSKTGKLAPSGQN